MELNVGKELAALNRMTVDTLRARYAEVFGESTNGRHKQWLVKRIIWPMQSLAEGDLTERARQRAAEIANDADIRRKAPKSPPAAADAARLSSLGGSRQPNCAASDVSLKLLGGGSLRNPRVSRHFARASFALVASMVRAGYASGWDRLMPR